MSQKHSPAVLQTLDYHLMNSPLSVIEWDHEFKVKKWSGRAESIFGWSEAEVIGKHPSDWTFVHEDDTDDVLVRGYVMTQLQRLGYRVVAAANGDEALKVLQSDEKLDLLFTDVVMPGGINGRELADRARKLRSDIRILFTSGYTENAIIHHGRLDPGVLLLSKPYRSSDLANYVRDALKQPLG